MSWNDVGQNSPQMDPSKRHPRIASPEARDAMKAAHAAELRAERIERFINKHKLNHTFQGATANASDQSHARDGHSTYRARSLMHLLLR